MFISFPMYIGLIILTIIMIVLIIYLSLTSNKKIESSSNESLSSESELTEENGTKESMLENMTEQAEFFTSSNKNTYNFDEHEHSTEELDILHYLKDDDFQQK